MTQERKDYLTLHFIVLIWGFTGILGLLIEIPSVEVVFFRTFIATILLFFLLKYRKKSLRISSKKQLVVVLATGGLIGLHWILFFLSARISNASVCFAGMVTCSLWTSLIEPLVQRKKIRLFEVLLSVIAFSGVFFSIKLDFMAGLLTAILSAFVAALFTVINGQLVRKNDPYVIIFYEMVGACLSIILFFPFYRLFFVDSLALTPSTMDWVYLFLLASVCTAYAYSISVELMKRLSAFSVNLVINLEPFYGIILALIIFGAKEQMNLSFYLDLTLILMLVLLYPVLNRKYKKRRFEKI